MMTQAQKSILLALFSVFVGGLGSVVFKKLLERLPYQELAVAESFFLTLVFALWGGWKLKEITPRGLLFLCGGSLVNACGSLFFFLSLVHFSPIEFSFLGRNHVTFAIILGCVVLGERHGSLTWVAMLVALLGSYIFTYATPEALSYYSIFCVFLFCLSLAVRSLLLKLGPPLPLNAVMFWGNGFSFLLALMNILYLDPLPLDVKKIFLSSDFPLIAAVTFLSQAVGLSCFFKAIYLGQLSFITSLRALSPFSVALISLFLIEYEWTTRKLVGFLFCSLSVVLFITAERVAYRKEKAKTKALDLKPV